MDGNVVGKANSNPIKDTRTYEIKFPDDKIAELTANAIAEAMYSACDHNGNKYLLFDCFVYYKKSDKACIKEGQQQSTAVWHFVCSGWMVVRCANL